MSTLDVIFLEGLEVPCRVGCTAEERRVPQSLRVEVKPIASPDRSQIKAVISKHFSTKRGQVFSAVDQYDFSVASFVLMRRFDSRPRAPSRGQDAERRLRCVACIRASDRDVALWAPPGRG